jgi:hypothetical protein
MCTQLLTVTFLQKILLRSHYFPSPLAKHKSTSEEEEKYLMLVSIVFYFIFRQVTLTLMSFGGAKREVLVSVTHRSPRRARM